LAQSSTRAAPPFWAANADVIEFAQTSNVIIFYINNDCPL